jgi:hypothetical protein
LAESGTSDRSLLNGEVLRFSADFTHPLSCNRAFKFLHHLVKAFGIGSIIAMPEINIHNTILT